GMPDGAPAPRVYMGEHGIRADHLAFGGDPLPSEHALNALPAVTRLELLRALLDPERVLSTSVPGLRGLPGGFPVRAGAGRIELDLPSGVELGEAIAFQWESARLDGVKGVDPDGTVHFTATARSALASHDPELTEPLELRHLEARLERLVRFLDRQ